MTQVLGRSLTRLGHDVRVIGVYPRDYPAPNFEVDEGVRIWRLRDYRTKGSWIYSRRQLFKQVEKWALAGEVDILEVPDHQGWAAGWGKLNVPVIGRLHGSLTYFATELGRCVGKIPFWLERASLRRFDYICSVSEYTSVKTKQVFNLSRGSDAVLYNPVEMVPDSSAVPRLQNHVVFSGTLTPKKGIAQLIKAWPTVVQLYPDAHLHIFGKDARTYEGRSMQESLSEALNGTRATVHFHGHVSRQRLFDEFRRARVAVFPSYAEAFAIAPLEAMACGCATIYSSRGSGPELMEHGREGLLIDPDRPDELAAAIVRMLSDSQFAKQAADLGRARIREHFSLERLTERNLAFYRHCADEFRARQDRDWRPISDFTQQSSATSELR